MTVADSALASPATAPLGRRRWLICALLFTATTINYMDRSVLGVLGPTLQYRVFHWSDADYATINMAFKSAYAIGMLTMGALIDRLGTKVGYTLAIGIWSVFGMLHAAVRPLSGVLGFSFARFGLGFGESGNFPAAIKTVAEWFPKKDRALATGLFNAGSNVGAILAPLIVPLLVWPDGTHWQFAFLTTGVFSALWVVFWLRTYHAPEDAPRLSPAELAYIQSDSAREDPRDRLPWRSVLGLRETWAFALGKVTDAVWWFYLFWGGKFLFDRFGLDIKSVGLPLIVIYVVADAGSIAGGWLSSAFIRRGWSVNRARKSALLISALCVMPVMFATQIGTRFGVNAQFYERLNAQTFTVERHEITEGTHAVRRDRETVPLDVVARLHALDGASYASAKQFAQAVAGEIGAEPEKRMESALMNAARSDELYWLSVLLIALAAAGHQAWSANLFTLVSDVFPRKATASVTGIGGMVGALAGLAADYTLGQLLTESGPSGYFFAFLFAGSCYLLVLGVVHVLMPTLTPLDAQLRRVAN